MQSITFEDHVLTIGHYEYLGHEVYIIPNFPENGRLTLYAPTMRVLADYDAQTNSIRAEEDLLGLVLRERSEFRTELSSRAHSHRCPTRHIHRRSSFFPLSVAITRNCSLGCKYCHAHAGIDSDASDGVLLASLNHALRQIQTEGLKGLHVSFAVGGEPTFRWRKFQDFVHRVENEAKARGLEVYRAITTNGYYGLPKREFLASHFDSILLSFDGPQSLHDQLRPTKTGKSSFARVLESCRYFSNHVSHFAVRCTIVRPSLERIEAIVSFFVDVAGLKPENDIVLEPMIAIGRGSCVTQLQPNGAEFARAFWQAYKYGKSRGYRVKSSAFNPTRLVTTFCHAMSTPSFAVTVDGKVTACERDCEATDYCYGALDCQAGQFSLSSDAIRRNEAFAALPTHCEECICKWHCAGDCPDTRRFGYDRCEGNLFLLLAHIRELLDTN